MWFAPPLMIVIQFLVAVNMCARECLCTRACMYKLLKIEFDRFVIINGNGSVSNDSFGFWGHIGNDNDNDGNNDCNNNTKKTACPIYVFGASNANMQLHSFAIAVPHTPYRYNYIRWILIMIVSLSFWISSWMLDSVDLATQFRRRQKKLIQKIRWCVSWIFCSESESENE